jgi:sodium-dependent dicarboxylate transporter 2/3/5
MKAQQLNRIIGPMLAALIVLIGAVNDGQLELIAMGGIGVWMAYWWMTEAVPMAVTALLPIVFLPLSGIAPAKEVARQYMDSILFLFIGGFILAFALEKWHLHKRIALKILSAVGTKPSRVLLGVMLAAYLLSMWISNTATVMMLMSAVGAVVMQMDEHTNDTVAKNKQAAGLFLGLAFAANIGGMATLVGTPTNMIFYREYLRAFPDATDMNFLQWALVGVPVSLLLLTAAYFILRQLFCSSTEPNAVSYDYFRKQLSALGKWSREEKVVASVFTVTALLWFTRNDIDLGEIHMNGWSGCLGEYSKYVDDGTVAIAASIFLFLFPSSRGGESIMTWKDAERLPFDIILLFGGGFALAYGFEQSGLSVWMASGFSAMESWPLVAMVAGLAALICVISEFASNVASIQLMIPVLLALAPQIGVSALSLLVPATLAASLGFMLPVATAPNTIVFGSRRIKTTDMMKAGFWIDLIGVAVITACCYLLR